MTGRWTLKCWKTHECNRSSQDAGALMGHRENFMLEQRRRAFAASVSQLVETDTIEDSPRVSCKPIMRRYFSCNSQMFPNRQINSQLRVSLASIKTQVGEVFSAEQRRIMFSAQALELNFSETKESLQLRTGIDEAGMPKDAFGEHIEGPGGLQS